MRAWQVTALVVACASACERNEYYFLPFVIPQDAAPLTPSESAHEDEGDAMLYVERALGALRNARREAITAVGPDDLWVKRLDDQIRVLLAVRCGSDVDAVAAAIDRTSIDQVLAGRSICSALDPGGPRDAGAPHD